MRINAARFVARGLLQVLLKLHMRGYLHGDVNPQNVMLQMNKSQTLTGVKLVDFAFCRALTELENGFRKMALWTPPPEFFQRQGKTLGTAIDIWHSGVLLLQIVKGEIVDYSKDDILAGKPYEDALALDAPFANAIAAALHDDPQQRPDAIGLWRLLKIAK
jgi:serine/threonine protein kinase